MPVCAPGLAAALTAEEIPCITYPGDVFLGRVFDLHVAPGLPERPRLVPRAETALTLAACEYALLGMGVAWLPLTLAAPHLEAGRLVQAADLPGHPLAIRLRRLGRARPAIWDALTARLQDFSR